MNIIIIQPPLVQLNTPYPSGAYLYSFFSKLNKDLELDGNVRWFDFSTLLFHKVFSKEGLSIIFNKSRNRALKLASKYEKEGDDESAFQLRRYISQSSLWISWIDKIKSIVCGSSFISGREFTHEFVRSAHVPRGRRVENYLSNINRDVGVDDSQIIASLALADIADYITFAYDSNFALIRYAERLATSISSFDDVIQGLESPILTDFYNEMLNEHLLLYNNQENLFCISVPFPGTFEAAVFTGRYLKQKFKKSYVAMGGGYINTELRTLKEKRLFDYCDFLSYDKGYGSYYFLFNQMKNKQLLLLEILDGSNLYKIKYLHDDFIIEQLDNDSTIEKKELYYIKNVYPDFTDVDFRLSPRLADDINPMHRIWNDGAWIKAYMAYGCYWAKCAFCDTSLDYVNNFCMIEIKNLYKNLYKQCESKGVYGIHFVDEACPPKSLQQFALYNLNKRKTGPSLTYWGNIRFERTFSRDFADLMSYAGLTAVSGGVEIATGKGLDSVNKGTNIENIVSACCAFKEAGILVHSYMIFGFWNQSDQDLIDSMETLRQLFQAGLLDSAFWHKFSLTMHSTVYREWKQGKHPELRPIASHSQQFAENDIHFQGEQKSNKYSIPLNQALELWMHGDSLNKPVESFFPFKMPSPSISKKYIEKLISRYETIRDSSFSKKPISTKPLVWIGGEVIILEGNTGISQLSWNYMGELLYADIETNKASYFVSILQEIKAENFIESNLLLFQANRLLEKLGEKLFYELRGKGLCQLI